MENKIEFDLEKYNSGEYDVVTRSGLPVYIAGINQKVSKYYQIVGWVKGKPVAWLINGKDFEGGQSDFDLFLIPPQ